MLEAVGKRQALNYLGVVDTSAYPRSNIFDK